jgi:hypothetical protein
LQDPDGGVIFMGMVRFAQATRVPAASWKTMLRFPKKVVVPGLSEVKGSVNLGPVSRKPA